MEKSFITGLEFKSVVEAVNFFTGKSYKAWMKGSYQFNENYFVWFPHFTSCNEPLKGGWINTISKDGKEIHEKNIDSSINIDWSEKHPKYRLVAGNIDMRPPYKFYGVYELDKEKSTKYENVYKRVSDHIHISELQ